jgi:hypothetical protein
MKECNLLNFKKEVEIIKHKDIDENHETYLYRVQLNPTNIA